MIDKKKKSKKESPKQQPAQKESLPPSYTAESGDSVSPAPKDDRWNYGGGPGQKPLPPESGGFV